MHEQNISAAEAVLRHMGDMKEMFDFNYLDLIKNDGEEIDRMYKQMLAKKLL